MTGLLDQAEADRQRDGVRRVLRGEPVLSAPEAILHGLFADAGNVGDHRGGHPVRQVAERLDLGVRKVVALRLRHVREVADERAFHA